MKKLLILLLVAIVVTGCNDNNENGKNNSTDNNNQGAENNQNSEQVEENGDKDVYQIGETAQIINAQSDFPYEITVNDFKLTKEIDGKSLEDFYDAGSPTEDDRIAVVNVTMKNTGEESFVPNETMDVRLIGDMTMASTFDKDFFTERDEELKPGEEITGNLVYVSNYLFEDGVVYLIYEEKTDEETKFELQVPEK